MCIFTQIETTFKFKGTYKKKLHLLLTNFAFIKAFLSTIKIIVFNGKQKKNNKIERNFLYHPVTTKGNGGR